MAIKCTIIPCNAFESLCDIVNFPDTDSYVIDCTVINPDLCAQNDASIVVITNLPFDDTEWTWYINNVPFTPNNTILNPTNLPDGDYRLEGKFGGFLYTCEVTIGDPTQDFDPLYIDETITNANNN